MVSRFTSIPQTLAVMAIWQLPQHGLHVRLDDIPTSRGRFPGVIAEAVLRRLEKEVLPRCPHQSWAMFVDDTFVVIQRNKADMLWDQSDLMFPDIQFTRELEQDN